MRNTWLIARREYIERVHTKAFLISTILIPLLLYCFTVLPAKMITRKATGVRNIVVVASSQEFGQQIRERISQEANDSGRQYKVTVDANPAETERDALRGKVTRGEIDGFVWATDESVAARKVTYTGRETSDFIEIGSLQEAVSHAHLRNRLAAAGVKLGDLDDVLKPVSMETVRLEGGRENRLSGPAMFTVAVILAIFLYMTMIMYGVAVMRSVLDEKSSRIVEVMLASVTPKELMAGKVLGVGAVGLSQLMIWGVAAGVLGAPGVVAVAGMGLSIPIRVLLWLPVFFLLGFALYSVSYAALGASVNTEQEAQQFQMIVMLPLILAITMMYAVIRQPNSGLAIALSIFPFTAPVLMYLRMVVSEPPAWQLGLSLGLLLATIYGMVVLCARIYRVGILMYGKRPTLPEILRWLRYA